MNRTQVRDDLLKKLGPETAATAPTHLFDDIAQAVNWAFQRMWSAPFDYFRRQDRSFSTAGGTSSYALGDDVVELFSPVRAPGRDLIPVKNKGDFHRFAQRYFASDSSALTKPRAYYYDRTAGSDPDDPIESAVLLTPTPVGIEQIDYAVATTAPRIEACDMNTTDPLPIPHTYVESLFMPLARWNLMQSNWIDRGRTPPNMEFYREAYQTALIQLGYNDPQLDSNDAEKPSPTPDK